MGNTQQKEREIKFAEGEKHPVVLDPSTVYEVNVSGMGIDLLAYCFLTVRLVSMDRHDEDSCTTENAVR
jgi:hypothetical protein